MTRFALTVALLATAARLDAAGNFTCDDAELARRAEAARSESARFWSGGDLPGAWGRACPITWTERTARHSGGGATTFAFDRGEVFGWRMTVCGERQVVLHDVLPHEVDHAVRATLVRRPITRWLDEGCAVLMESASAHERQRALARRWLDDPAVFRRFDAADYPREGDEVLNLYATGFSLVEFLSQRGGPERLLQFQADARPPSQKLETHYGVGVKELRRDWSTWFRKCCVCGADCRCFGCIRHGAPPAESRPAPSSTAVAGDEPHSPFAPATSRPVLVIFTQPNCPGCRLAEADVRAGRFSRFEVVKVTRSEQSEWAWSDDATYRRFLSTTSYDEARDGALPAPTLWIRDTRHFRVGYSEERRVGILNGLLEAIGGAAWSETPPRPVPPSIPPVSAPPPPVPAAAVAIRCDCGEALRGLRGDVDRLQAAIAAGQLRGPPGPAGRDADPDQLAEIERLRREVDALRSTVIPVQIVDEHDRVVSEQTFPLGKAIRLRMRPDAK